jgi:hypothetical protein
VVTNTPTALSWLFTIPIIPVKKAATPDSPDKDIGTEIKRLLKKVSPPSCPEATMIIATRKKMTNPADSPNDHLPRKVFGRKYNVMGSC